MGLSSRLTGAGIVLSLAFASTVLGGQRPLDSRTERLLTQPGAQPFAEWLDSGNDPNTKFRVTTLGSQEWTTPLLIAVSRNNLAGVKLLLTRGADPNIAAGDQPYYAAQSPLNLAAKLPSPEIVEALVRAGALVNGVPGVRAFSPLFTAVNAITRERPEDGARLRVIEFLLTNGADPNGDALKGRPIQQAAYYYEADQEYRLNGKHAETLGLLKRFGANMAFVGGAETLCRAAAEGNLVRIKELVAMGLDLSHPTSPERMFPLVAAAANGRKDVVEYLLAQKVFATVTTAEGVTPAIAAAYGGHDALLPLLPARAGHLIYRDIRGFDVDDASTIARLKIRGILSTIERPLYDGVVILRAAERGEQTVQRNLALQGMFLDDPRSRHEALNADRQQRALQVSKTRAYELLNQSVTAAKRALSSSAVRDELFRLIAVMYRSYGQPQLATEIGASVGLSPRN